MNELLKIILSLSISGALLIFALLLCKPLIKDKLSKRWQYYIWLIVVARLLLPFASETNLMGTVFQHFDNTMIQMNTSTLPETDFPDQYHVLGQAGASGVEQLEPDKVATPSIFEMAKQNISIICLLVWLIVAIGLLIRKITVYQSFVKYIKAGRIEISDMALWERVGKLIEQTGIKGSVGLYTNSLISTPLLIGFFRPCIMLPTTELSKSDFENTILHELTHYKRRDMFYKWLVQVTICLHWFNPFVYLMGREVNRLCELSCDEAVIKSMDAGEQRAYGDTLLNAMGMGGNYKDSLASVTLNEGKELLKERLDAIMKFKKTTRLTAAISIALVVTVCFGAMAAGTYTAAPSENGAIQQGQQAKTNGNTTTTDITNSRVIREGEVYYIFCDGADESNKPTVGSVGNIAAFVLVRKDSYTSISGFTSLEKLVDEVTEQCDDMLEKRSITQDEAILIVEVATKIQSGNDRDFKDHSSDGEYAEWGIVKENGAYYYKNERVRIFVDLRADNTLVAFKYDKKSGTIDIRLVRDENGTIKKVEYLTQAEVKEILSDLNN